MAFKDTLNKTKKNAEKKANEKKYAEKPSANKPAKISEVVKVTPTKTVNGKAQTATKALPKSYKETKGSTVAKLEAKKKAGQQWERSKAAGLDSSSLTPLNLLKRDAISGTTTRDKIRYARTPGAVGRLSSSEVKAKNKKAGEARAARDQKSAAQILSRQDKRLSNREQTLIRDAKTSYDEAMEKGDKSGMQDAHKRAEIIRKSHGYSGGVTGQEYQSPELTHEEKVLLNKAGQERLKMAKMNLEAAKSAGNKNGIAAAERVVKSILETDAFRNEGTKKLSGFVTGHGQTVDRKPLSMEEFREGEKKFNEGLYSVMAAVPGSILSLVETSDQAIENDFREKNWDYINEKANNLELYKARLALAKKGEGNPKWGTVAQLEQQVKIAENAEKMRSAGTTVDPTLPGQTLMRKSTEAQQKFMEGRTGADKLLASAALSMGQMVPALAVSAIPGVGPAVGAGIMGAQAAGSKAYELNERGVSPAEAQLRGVVSGGIESVTEKIPISNLLKVVKAGGGSSLIKSMAKQAGIEATEESISYALNYAADVAFKDPEAKFSMKDLLESAAVGAISGGTLGGIGSLAGRKVYGSQPQETAQPSRLESLGQQALMKASGLKDRFSPPAETAQNAAEDTSVPTAEDIQAEGKTAQQEEETPRERFNRRYQDVMTRIQAVTEDPSQKTPEVYAALSSELQAVMEEGNRLTQQERQDAGQVSHNFGQAESHIDNRTPEEMGSRSVKAFQFDHPQLHQYYVQAAEALKRDAEYSFETQRSERGNGTVVRRSEQLELAESMGLTRNEIIRVCDDIIADNGQENYAAAKRVELVLDDMLSRGYIPNEGTAEADTKIPANEAYIQAKNQIPGAVTGFDRYKRDNALALELGEVTEEELRAEYEAGLPEGQGAMSKGGAGGFARWQAETPGTQFHPINEKSAQRSADLYGRAPIEVPKRDPAGFLTSKAVSTMVNAGVTPNELVDGILERSAAGDFSRIAYGDDAAISFAEAKITSDGFDASKDKWIADVNAGKSSKDITTMGTVLFQNAANSKTGSGVAEALEIAAIYYDYCTRTAQSMQAMSILNKLTPEGQLYVAVRTGERAASQSLERLQKRSSKADREINEEILDATTKARDAALEELANLRGNNETGATFQGEGERGQTAEENPLIQEYSERISYLEQSLREETRRRKAAENVVHETVNAFREPQTDEFGGWVSEIAKELSEKLNKKNGSTQRPVPISRTILSDLMKFADETMQKHRNRAGNKRTAAERIADYFANRKEYDRAWAEAQEIMREKYANDQQKLEQLDEFLSSRSAYNVTEESPLILRAIADDLAANEISKVQRDMRSAYDYSALALETFYRINGTVQATGTDADMLQSAIANAFMYAGETVDAESRIRTDTNKALREIGVKMRDIIVSGEKTKEDVAKKIATMLINDYGISSAGAEQLSDDIVDAFNQRVLEASRKELDRRFQNRPARAKKSMEKKLEELYNLGAFTSPRYNESATEKLFGFFGVTLDPSLAKAFLEAKTELAQVQAMDAIYKDIGRQLPATWEDKFTAWRYTSMLGNLATIEKNFLGNIPTIPMRLAKDAVGVGLQRVLNTDYKTKALYNPLSGADKARRAAAREDFEIVKGEIMSGGATNEGLGKIADGKTIFKNRIFEGYRKGTNFLMEFGDEIFSKTAYIDGLSQWLKAHNISAELFADMSPTEKQGAREYAVNYAQKAVFRDINGFSRMVTKLGKMIRSDNKAEHTVGIFVEGILPFKKTPANIAVRGVEYSPVGLAVGMKKAFGDVRAGNKTSAEAIEWLSSGLVGTGVVGLGFLLAHLGFVTGGGTGDDKQDGFDKLQGHQEYALEIGDKSFTIGWLSPMSLPFFTGVEIFNFLNKAKGGKIENGDAVLSAILGMTEPMLQMSMMQSLEDALSSVSYADNMTMSILANAVVGYVNQFFPTLLGQFERTTEGRRQTTFVDKQSWIPADAQRALARISNKIPFYDYNQVDYVDEWGRTQENSENILLRAAKNFLSPAYISEIKTGSTEQELQRLYDLGKYEGIIPNSLDRSTTINGKYVTADQWVDMQTARGQTAKLVLDSVIGSDQYNEMSDDEKAKFVNTVYEYANAVSRIEEGDDPDHHDSWIGKSSDYAEKTGGDITDFFLARNKKNQIDADDNKQDGEKAWEFETWVDGQDRLSAEQKSYLKENLKIWGFHPADSSKYVKGTSAGLSVEQIRTASDAYSRADAEFGDGNGSVKQGELWQSIKALGLSDEESAKLYEQAKPKNWKATWYTSKRQ